MFLNGSSSVSDGDRYRIVGEDDFPANFKEYMRKEGLKCSRSKPDYRWSLNNGWVFWSQHHQNEPSLSHDNHVDFIPDVCVSPQVRDKIRYALQNLIWHQNLAASLVQFWAPTKTREGRTSLTTQHQPFALGKTFNMLEKQWLCEYRMSMMGREYSFYADEECEEEQLGLPGRVFRNRSLESTSEVIKYPQLDLDLCYWGLPVFEHSSQTCVGVLEIVCLCSMDLVLRDGSFLDRIYGIFQAQGVTLQLGQLDQRSIDGIINEMNGFSESQNKVLPTPEPSQNGKVTTQVDSSEQLPMDPSNNEQNVGTAEGNISVVTSSKEGTRKRQAREHKQTGVRIEISLEDILELSEMRRAIAARKLKVSISTLRRICRSYGITRWPPRIIENVHRPSPVVNQGQTPQLSTNLPSNQASASVAHIKPALQDGDMVTVKAKYENGVFKFQLTLLSTLAELQQEVAKRLNQEAGTYSFEYKDEDDDWITIACDEDLQDCMRTSRSLGKPSIVVQFKPKQPSTHS